MDENPVEAHYSRKGLFDKIVDSFYKNGIESIKRSDLSAVDEFHVRGAAVSVELANEAGISKGDKLIDIGCGIGGPARMLAEETGCHVTGIDITEDFIETANKLNKLLGMGSQVTFRHGDALNLPFEKEKFDFAWSQHVQMNIQNKKKLYDEVYRVLKPGAKFIWYDIFSKDHQLIKYPVPWANKEEISHLVTFAEFKQLLIQVGFSFHLIKEQTSAGIEFFEKQSSTSKNPGVPGLPIILGENAKEKFQNLLNNLKSEKLEIFSGICVKNANF